MATVENVTTADIDNLAAKLDEFAEVLDERERMFLLGLLEMAGKTLREDALGADPGAPSTSVSEGFRAAFAGAVGMKLQVPERQGT